MARQQFEYPSMNSYPPYIASTRAFSGLPGSASPCL